MTIHMDDRFSHLQEQIHNKGKKILPFTHPSLPKSSLQDVRMCLPFRLLRSWQKCYESLLSWQQHACLRDKGQPESVFLFACW